MDRKVDREMGRRRRAECVNKGRKEGKNKGVEEEEEENEQEEEA